jgi:glycosyltransferase involved in cell wall biosynthesis
LRIVLIGTFANRLDEGLRNISSRILKELQSKHEVVALNTGESLKWRSVQAVNHFRPDIVHYLNGPTIRSFAILRIYKLLLPHVVCIASATRPFFSGFSRWIVGALKPDLVLTQALRWETLFRSKGIKTSPLMNGVDLARFRPEDNQKKIELRKKYGIPNDKHILLHVGHIKKNRNLEIFSDISRKNESIQCVIVGGTSFNVDIDIKQQLMSAGCIVISKYIESIQEIYQLADCYVFCVQDRNEKQFPRAYREVGAIDTPLSVLEAMACNLPVITTRFGSLPRMFKEGNGVFFYDGGAEDLLRNIQKAANLPAIMTREAVLPYGWDVIISHLEKIYSDVVRTDQAV